jgi:hypothetical protein
MLNNSLSGKEIDFKTLEKLMFEFVCKLGRIIIKYLLELCDKQLMLSRDKKAYRHKGYKSTCIKTIMGPVEFKRVVYEHTDENGEMKFVYLLDEYLKLETIGFMSTNLVEKVIENATNVSYRKSAKNVTEMTGQNISHTAAWNVTQEFGERIANEEKKKIDKYYKGDLNGNKEVKVLFEEADGLWINMQGEDRPKKGNSRKREIKLAVTYEGWERKNEKTPRYLLHNKRAVAGFMDSEDFKDLRDANIAEEYNVDKIEVKLIGGDGADWIKQGIEEKGTHFQLDRYHIGKAVIRNVYDKREAKRILKMLNNGKEDKAIERIRELMYECGGEEDKVKKLQALETYLKNNREGLRLYKERDTIKLPELPEGLYYRNMGTAEHNICDILKLRMKGNKTSWSISGANNLAKILAVKASGNFQQTIDGLMSAVVPERFAEKFIEAIKNASYKAEKAKKSVVYPVRRGSMPFNGCALTEGMKVVRRFIDGNAVTDLV